LRRHEQNPAFSSDGTKIAFTKVVRDRISRQFRDAGMWTMNADGTGVRKLADAGDTPAWSPSGTRIVFSNHRDIFTIRPDGTGLRRLTAFGGGPNWSPDGARILFGYYDGRTDRITFYTVNTADGTLALIHSRWFLDGGTFTPDGTKITHYGYEGSVSGLQVLSLNADGSGTPTPLTSSGETNFYPDWGPA